MAGIKAEIAGKILTLLGYDGTDFYNVLVDAAGHLQIDAVSSALPTGAATTANQVIINTTVELVALLRNALQTVDSDRLIVRGEDQVFSYKDSYKERVVDSAGATGSESLTLSTVPAGEVWVVTNAVVWNHTNGFDMATFEQYDGVVGYFLGSVQTVIKDQQARWFGHVYLEPGDRMRVGLSGCTAGDTIRGYATGYKMTLET